ncbi:MAG TPA: hypothetical protein VD993_14070 [Chitinophagaceae bacterium]|nr:hypothetical protein [Chitinophagaceae bacterium]
MKNVLSLLMLLVAAPCYVFSQTSGAIVTRIPSSFTAEDQVKIIVDVSNVPNLAGKEPLYIWTWNPGDPAPGNGSWDNSNEGRKMVKEGPNKWSWTFTPTQYYGKTPAEITQISFLVKAKNGNGDLKTDDIHLPVAPLVYVPTAFRTFPKVVGQGEAITFFLDQSLATDITTQRMNPTGATISLFSDAGAQVDAAKNVTLTNLGPGVYSGAFFPSKLFNIPAGVTIGKMRVVFKGKIKDANGNDVDAESAFEYGFDPLK